MRVSVIRWSAVAPPRSPPVASYTVTPATIACVTTLPAVDAEQHGWVTKSTTYSTVLV